MSRKKQPSPNGRKSERLSRRTQGKRKRIRLLIVCEGQKTESHYFKGLKSSLDLPYAKIKIGTECQSDPLKMYKYAVRLCQQANILGVPFERVYCVFDKDSHGTYQQAMEKIAKDKSTSTFIAINSVPCFEYWLLLHFTPSTKPYRATPGSSACDQVERELKKHLPDYSKSDDTIFEALKARLDTATQNAKRTLREAEKNQTDNPSTRVHELVEQLQSIEKR